MKLEDYDIVYFLGIGGIGMSALARWFNHHGYKVSGYDRVRSSLCQQLEAEGMIIHYDDDVSKLPHDGKNKTLYIYTPAIPKDLKIRMALENKGVELLKRSQVLGIISKSFFTVAVGGTHGKTTTTSMITHLLSSARKDVTAFLGGISADLNSNFIANKTNDAIAVVEADEFDRSFLTLNPNLAVITSTDADHLDIYENREHLLDSFRAFCDRLDKEGTLFINEKCAEELSVEKENVKTYGIDRGQFFAYNITVKDGYFYFDFHSEEREFHELKLGVPGYHNVENAVAAVAIAIKLGIDISDIKAALASFKGVRRRFELVYRGSKHILVDDYAHHPTELEAFINSMKALYPGRHLTVIFQPHLYSRTRDFAEGFSRTLSLADRLILLDIYPAREMPIPGVSSNIIFDKVTGEKMKVTKENLIQSLQDIDLEVVATVGAGDIDTLVKEVKDTLIRKEEAA